MRIEDSNVAVVVPMANEAHDFFPFITEMKKTLDTLKNATVYFVVDNASKDSTFQLCRELSDKDHRFVTIFAPESRNVVHAYMRGFREAYQNGHEIIIEMDAGLSHDPAELSLFIDALNNGYECAFGSRNVKGGSNLDSPASRRFLSTGGTILSNLFLGTRLHDMTSGFQGFRRHVIEKLINYPLKSTAHFYQTEVRYLLRKYKAIEIPIHYRSPSPRVRWNCISNSFRVLGFYILQRLKFRSIAL